MGTKHVGINFYLRWWNPTWPRGMSFSASSYREMIIWAENGRIVSEGSSSLRSLVCAVKKSKPKGYMNQSILLVFHILLLFLYGLIKYSFSRAWFYFIFLSFVVWASESDFSKKQTWNQLLGLIRLYSSWRVILGPSPSTSALPRTPPPTPAAAGRLLPAWAGQTSLDTALGSCRSKIRKAVQDTGSPAITGHASSVT